MTLTAPTTAGGSTFELHEVKKRMVPKMPIRSLIEPPSSKHLCRFQTLTRGKMCGASTMKSLIKLSTNYISEVLPRHESNWKKARPRASAIKDPQGERPG